MTFGGSTVNSAQVEYPWAIDHYHPGVRRWSIFERFATRKEAELALENMRKGAKQFKWKQPTARVVPSNIRELEQLGGLSAKYESAKAGSSTVSEGKGDAGGVSYGTYQLKSVDELNKIPPAKQFVDRFYSDRFATLTAGTPEFTSEWNKLVAQHKHELAANELLFIADTHYLPHLERAKAETGLDLDNGSQALREVVWSISVQHPIETYLYRSAIRPLLRSKTAEELSDREIIQALYKERRRTDANGILVHFKRSPTKQVQEGLKKRFAAEEKDALEILSQEPGE
ncbi:MAG: hypothetical protein RJP95_00320 [Pirellulales bacterium]